MNPLCSLVRVHLASDQPVALRSLATEVLAKAKKHRMSRLSAMRRFASISPARNRQRPPRHRAAHRRRSRCEACSRPSKRRAELGLPVGTLKQRLAQYSPKVQDEAENIGRSNSMPTRHAKSEARRTRRQATRGDVRRGQAVFHSPKRLVTAFMRLAMRASGAGSHQDRHYPRSVICSNRCSFPAAASWQGFEPRTIVTPADACIKV